METPNEQQKKSPARVGLLSGLAIVAATTLCGLLLGWLFVAKPLSHKSTVAQQGVSMFVYDESLEDFSVAWQTELSRRFRTPTIALLLHGGGPVAKDWDVQDNSGGGYGTTAEPATALVDRIHEEHPDCIIVLLACNPSHVAIHDRPWLYYSPALTWCVPDRFVKPFVNGADVIDPTTVRDLTPNELDNRSAQFPDAVGNAYELVEAN